MEYSQSPLMPTSATASDNAVSLTYALPPQVQIIYALPSRTRKDCCIFLNPILSVPRSSLGTSMLKLRLAKVRFICNKH